IIQPDSTATTLPPASPPRQIVIDTPERAGVLLREGCLDRGSVIRPGQQPDVVISGHLQRDIPALPRLRAPGRAAGIGGYQDIQSAGLHFDVHRPAASMRANACSTT